MAGHKQNKHFVPFLILRGSMADKNNPKQFRMFVIARHSCKIRNGTLSGRLHKIAKKIGFLKIYKMTVFWSLDRMQKEVVKQWNVENATRKSKMVKMFLMAIFAKVVF